MKDGMNAYNTSVFYNRFDGDLTRIEEYELIDCVGLFMVERSYNSPKTKRPHETTVTFELGSYGEVTDGEFWFSALSDELTKFIVNKNGKGKRYEYTDRLPIEDSCYLGEDAMDEYVEEEGTDNIIVETQCTLCELVKINTVAIPEVEIEQIGLSAKQGGSDESV